MSLFADEARVEECERVGRGLARRRRLVHAVVVLGLGTRLGAIDPRVQLDTTLMVT